MSEKILYLFTRTPLHVGAGASVGAIDQPIQRQRHTGLPLIPATTIKGVFADEWNEPVTENQTMPGGITREVIVGIQRTADGTWLFGSDDPNNASAGALQFSEARLLAFPIRSAKGSFAWITCPLMLRRALRDGVLRDAGGVPPTIAGQPPAIAASPFAQVESQTGDENALFLAVGPLALRPAPGQVGDTTVVLEEYTFVHKGELPAGLADALQRLLPADEVWKEIASRLVILSDGMMSFFAQNACEVAQHNRISDETGTAEGGALFNQENVPSETLFYSVVRFFSGRGERFIGKTSDAAATEFSAKLAVQVFQFGGDASTGLGYCTVKLS